MTIQDEVSLFIRTNPGVAYKRIMTHFVMNRGYKRDTIKGAIKRFKKRYPLEYHPGISQSDFDKILKVVRASNDAYSVSTERLPAHIVKALGLDNPSNRPLSQYNNVDTYNNVNTLKDNVDTISHNVPTHEDMGGCISSSNIEGSGDLDQKKGDPVGCREVEIISINRPPPDIGFREFVEQFGYPRFGGTFEFQDEIFRICWERKYSMINVPRDHGKSIYLAFLCQWAMDCHNWDVLYLGWTDRRKEIAEFVYAYFNIMNLVESAKVKASSAYHFQILSGAKFDTYMITAKEILGMHALGQTQDQETRRLLIIIDDPIDETFREERHKETKLETKWRSTISNINADKIIFTGTKKFEEDFFWFVKKTFKRQLVHYYRRTHLCTPFIEDLDLFWGDLNHKHAFYCIDEPTRNEMIEKALQSPCYNPDLEFNDLRYKRGIRPLENLLCPERWTEPELQEKRKEIGEYWWHSEYEQNPHPITGEVWEEVQYIRLLEHWKEYDMAMIVVDPATATEAKKVGTPAPKKLKATSYTGIIVMLRHAPTQEYHVIEDLTDYYEFEAKLQIIEAYYQLLRQKYTGIKVKTVIEKQGGGDDIISSATSRKEFKFSGTIIDVHQTRDKIMRIDDYLRGPIKTGKIKFLYPLRNSELIKEILNFPYCEKFDAVDALATGVKAFDDFIPGMTPEEVSILIDKIRQRRTAKYEREWSRKNQTPWIKPQPKLKKRF